MRKIDTHTHTHKICVKEKRKMVILPLKHEHLLLSIEFIIQIRISSMMISFGVCVRVRAIYTIQVFFSASFTAFHHPPAYSLFFFLHCEFKQMTLEVRNSAFFFLFKKKRRRRKSE